MQPLGRKPSRFPGKEDCRIPGNLNWWEDEMGDGQNKKSDKEKVKKEIKKELSDYDRDRTSTRNRRI